LHGEDGEVPVEDLDWIVEDLALDGLSLCVLLVIFGVDFGLALCEEGGVVLADEVSGFVQLH